MSRKRFKKETTHFVYKGVCIEAICTYYSTKYEIATYTVEIKQKCAYLLLSVGKTRKTFA